MTVGAGVLRSADSLAASAGDECERCAHRTTRPIWIRPSSAIWCHLAVALLEAATTREETRGAHTRSDAPEPSNDKYRVICMREAAEPPGGSAE